MDIAFVKNSEDHVHDKNGGDQEQWQRFKKLPEHKRLALKRRLNARILAVHSRERVFDEFGRVANCYVWQQIEINCDTGELIEMVYSLRPDDLTCRCYRTQGNKVRACSSRRSDSVAPRAAAALGNCAAAIAAYV